MSYKIHLLNKAIVYLKDAVEYFKNNTLCGKFIIEINFFKGGITSIKKFTEETEK